MQVSSQLEGDPAGAAEEQDAGRWPGSAYFNPADDYHLMKQLMSEALEELRRMKALDVMGERIMSMVPWISRKGLLDSAPRRS